MSLPQQNFNTFAEPAEAKLQLSVLEGGGQEYVGVLQAEVRETDDSGDHRIEVLTLRSGRRYTCIVTEADQPHNFEIGGTDLTLLVPGFTEMPSAIPSTASNLHKEYANRNRNVRTVSVDRRGYSKYSGPGSLREVLDFARQSKEQTASDLLDIAHYYAEGNSVTLWGTSAGFDIDLDVVKQNGQDPARPVIDISKKIYGIVPCVVAKNEREHAIFRADQPETITRALTVIGFAGHCAVNLTASTIRNPRGTWDSRGILTALARNPLLPLMLPIHFVGHTEGRNFIDILDVAEYHQFVIAAGGKDLFTAKKQYEAIETIHPGSVDQRVDPKHGHLSYPLAVGEALDALGMRKQVVQPAENIVQGGLKLVTGLVKEAASLTPKTLGLAGRIGGKAISTVWQSSETTQAA